jgi:hypothetical protein
VYPNSFQQAAHAALIEAADAKSAALEKLRVQFTAKYAKLAQEVSENCYTNCRYPRRYACCCYSVLSSLRCSMQSAICAA